MFYSRCLEPVLWGHAERRVVLAGVVLATLETFWEHPNQIRQYVFRDVL